MAAAAPAAPLHLLTAARPCPVPAVAMATTSSLKHRLIITVPAIFGDRIHVERKLDPRPGYDKLGDDNV